jgi:hypothetical protein
MPIMALPEAVPPGVKRFPNDRVFAPLSNLALFADSVMMAPARFPM